LCRIFGEETAGDGGACVEAYFELVAEGKEVFFDVSGYGIVLSLENGGKKGPSSGLNIVDLLDVRSPEVRETKLSRGVSN
jgi:hypothetical protein